MSFLLDTNVVSEWVRPRPDPGVVAWLAAADEDRVFLSVVSLAELRHGIDRLADGRRRHSLDAWLREQLPLRFADRILPVDRAIADRWGVLVARRDAAGRPIGAMDAFIAATAAVHGLTLVTRNAADFQSVVMEIVNPWRD
ncbi:MAG: type II toxin-antitoxin system VapC family toxin [Alphaproteobacteria bacterium]|nr:type II toxin-antitoxin system VapC family toxin [Alphaproteobacteria bacterium]MCW5743931.1 type II toxin-antitoxin system VapC family toxin [Alphaproteobacteria bacterium]